MPSSSREDGSDKHGVEDQQSARARKADGHDLRVRTTKEVSGADRGDSVRHGDGEKKRRRRGDDGGGNDTDDDSVNSGTSSVNSRESERRRRRKRRKRRGETSLPKKGGRRSRREKAPSKKSSRKKESKKRRYSPSSPSEDDDASSSPSSSSSSSDPKRSNPKESRKVVAMNERLLAKLSSRGETLEERKERRAQKRAAKIESRFGYTAEDNPFNDPNLHETFVWNKKLEKDSNAGGTKQHPDAIEEIETIRRRRKERDLEREEMDRLRAEEARMKELENYDDWAKKEEEFHLEQQRKRSAIRLVEGREKPVDVLAKNVLLFGLTEEEKQQRAAVKYQERYNALDELQKLDAELEEPHKIVGILKLVELQELLVDIEAFRLLEKEAMGGNGNATIIMYWDALGVVVKDEIMLLQNGGDESPYVKKVESIKGIFEGQSRADLISMRGEIQAKLSKAYNADGTAVDMDRSYWLSVLDQLAVHLAKMDLSELHSKMLVRQLEKLELRKEALQARQKEADSSVTGVGEQRENDRLPGLDTREMVVPSNVDATFGNLEEELGLTDEVAMSSNMAYSWQNRYAPRKPRYFNRVRTGFDWNKYNQTHYDSENPPPKIVQGYKFNIFYPDLVDPTATPQYTLERADSDEFCILRFHAGPPYEDIAFKIINREWNKSRKRGFRSTFERGVLSLYFNFASHWYRR
jgi:Cactus-binding C-terminus of cactin protein/Conserved mid region of cactin